MNNVLQNQLAEILAQLASFFGTTTETVMKNLPHWLSRYGWYKAFSDIPFAFIRTAISTFVIFIG